MPSDPPFQKPSCCTRRPELSGGDMVHDEAVDNEKDIHAARPPDDLERTKPHRVEIGPLQRFVVQMTEQHHGHRHEPQDLDIPDRSARALTNRYCQTFSN